MSLMTEDLLNLLVKQEGKLEHTELNQINEVRQGFYTISKLPDSAYPNVM